MSKIVALYVAVILTALIGCAARQTPSTPKSQKGVIGFEIRSRTDKQLVDDIDFDAPVTMERGPCRASTDCLIWRQGSDTFQREMDPDWEVTYRFAGTAAEAR